MQSTRPVFLSACLGMLLFGISLTTLGSVSASLQDKFQLDTITFGVLFSILPVGILLGSLLFGPFADRYGYKIILLLSCVFIFAGFQGIANTTSLHLLKVSIFLFGAGGGSINGATNALVADISHSHKGANLSLLGVFFAIGALGMPFVLGLLEERFSFEFIVSAIGYIPVAVSALYLITRFPLPKQSGGIPLLRGLQLLKEDVLIAIGFFLFCLSSFEAIVNNWTTLYLRAKLELVNREALFALSLYVAGMAVMRVLLGSVFRNVATKSILLASFFFLLAGCVMLDLSANVSMAIAGLICIGIGLAAGFPVMLGFVGSLYPEASGTAFSIVLSIALVGNMIVNLLMGVITDRFGIERLTAVPFVLLSMMFILALFILKKTKINHI